MLKSFVASETLAGPAKWVYFELVSANGVLLPSSITSIIASRSCLSSLTPQRSRTPKIVLTYRLPTPTLPTERHRVPNNQQHVVSSLHNLIHIIPLFNHTPPSAPPSATTQSQSLFCLRPQREVVRLSPTNRDTLPVVRRDGDVQPVEPR
jgi:hypothetical protein